MDLSLSYRIVRPMFVSGADPASAELRLASVKGALRFWWRAVHGQHASYDPARLRAVEDALFGSVRTGVSRVRLALPPDAELRTDRYEARRDFRPDTWQGYLGYGLVDRRQRPEREAFAAGQFLELRVHLAPASGAVAGPAESAALLSLARAFVALGAFGGLGGRSRRGWGSLTLAAPGSSIATALGLDPCPPELAAWGPPRTREEVEHWAETWLAAWRKLSRVPRFSAFSAEARVVVGPACRDAEAAHAWLGHEYRRFVRELATRPATRTAREDFGLPRSGAGQHAKRRRASPVLFHIHQADDRSPALPVVLFLPGRFLDFPERPGDAWDAVRRFLDELADKATASSRPANHA